MLKRIKKILKPCEICQRSKLLTIRYDELVQPILVNKPNEILSIDFYGPLPTSIGGVIYKIKKANTVAVINKIFKDYIVRFGKPVAIMMDHGTQFTSKKWTDTLRENGINPIFSSIRHLQSNIVERIHRELGRFFRVYTQHHSTRIRHGQNIRKLLQQ